MGIKVRLNDVQHSKVTVKGRQVKGTLNRIMNGKNVNMETNKTLTSETWT